MQYIGLVSLYIVRARVILIYVHLLLQNIDLIRLFVGCASKLLFGQGIRRHETYKCPRIEFLFGIAVRVRALG